MIFMYGLSHILVDKCYVVVFRGLGGRSLGTSKFLESYISRE